MQSNNVKKALNKWTPWRETTTRARSSIERRLGSFKKLVAESEMKFEDTADDTFFIRLNPQGMLLWKLHDEVNEIASNFVTQEMEIKPKSYLYHIFKDYWLESAFPEAMQWQNSDDEYGEEASDKKTTPIRASRKIVKVGKDFRVVYSVSWYPDKISPDTVARSIQKADWPKNFSYSIRKAKGGRPLLPKETILYPEAVTCAILKDN
jgi:hypothetical protein